MTHHPTRRTIITTTTAMLLSGCISLNIGQEDNAPYPADLDHLDDILAVSETKLPDGATNVTVAPASKLARSSPGTWGYVIAFHAEPQSIRDYVDTYTGNSGDYLERYSDVTTSWGIEDIDFTDIQHPWITSLENARLVIERPLGRCWLLIMGGFH